MIVVLEGGYNTNYLGQHASGVVKALMDQTPSEIKPSQADKDAGFACTDDIKGSNAQDWAVEDVAETKKCLQKYWKSLQTS